MPDKQDCEDTLNGSARESFQALSEISKILNTGLDDRTLSFCVRLCENGVHPEAIAKVMIEIRNQVNAMNEEAKTNK